MFNRCCTKAEEPCIRDAQRARSKRIESHGMASRERRGGSQGSVGGNAGRRRVSDDGGTGTRARAASGKRAPVARSRAGHDGDREDGEARRAAGRGGGQVPTARAREGAQRRGANVRHEVATRTGAAPRAAAGTGTSGRARGPSTGGGGHGAARGKSGKSSGATASPPPPLLPSTRSLPRLSPLPSPASSPSSGGVRTAGGFGRPRRRKRQANERATAVGVYAAARAVDGEGAGGSSRTGTSAVLGRYPKRRARRVGPTSPTHRVLESTGPVPAHELTRVPNMGDASGGFGAIPNAQLSFAPADPLRDGVVRDVDTSGNVGRPARTESLDKLAGKIEEAEATGAMAEGVHRRNSVFYPAVPPSSGALPVSYAHPGSPTHAARSRTTSVASDGTLDSPVLHRASNGAALSPPAASSNGQAAGSAEPVSSTAPDATPSPARAMEGVTLGSPARRERDTTSKVLIVYAGMCASGWVVEGRSVYEGGCVNHASLLTPTNAAQAVLLAWRTPRTGLNACLASYVSLARTAACVFPVLAEPTWPPPPPPLVFVVVSTDLQAHGAAPWHARSGAASWEHAAVGAWPPYLV